MKSQLGKWLDGLFAKLWWSRHPREAAFAKGALIDARLGYIRQVTKAIIELAPSVYEPEEAKKQIAIARNRLRDAEDAAYGLASLKGRT